MNINFEPRPSEDIKAAELKENNVYIESKRGDVWRVWIDFDGVPLLECVHRS